MRFRPASLRVRITLLVATVVAVALSAAAFAARAQFRSTLEDNARQTAQTLLEDFIQPESAGSSIVGGLTRFVYLDSNGDELDPSTVDRIITDHLDEVFPMVVFESGSSIAPAGADATAELGDLPVVGNVTVTGTIGSPIPPVVQLLDEAQLAEMLGAEVLDTGELDTGMVDAGGMASAFAVEIFTPVGDREPIDLDERTIAVGQPVTVGDTELTIAVAVPRDSIDDSVQAATVVGLIAIPLLTLLVGAVAWAVTSRTLRPVEAIRQQVELTDPSRLDHHVPRPGGGGEIDRLAGTMNDMLDRLHAASLQHRRFVSDASHELRGPITATIATIETTSANDAAARWADVAATITSEQQRLDRLVDDLLLLAELDERAGSPAPDDDVDLDELVLGDAARPRSVPVHTSIDTPHRRHGSARLLSRAISNLVDNAARHARSRVDVTLASDGDGGAVIRVDDDGEGIDPANRQRVLDRFTRLDEARHRDEGGAGLGLAIASEVARHHGGSLRVDDSPTGGARFELLLPAP